VPSAGEVLHYAQQHFCLFSFCEVQAWFLAIKTEVLFLEFIISREKCQHSDSSLFIKYLFTPQYSNSNNNNSKRKLEQKKGKKRLHKKKLQVVKSRTITFNSNKSKSCTYSELSLISLTKFITQMQASS